MGISMTVETITPGLAVKYLQQNVKNYRKLKKPIYKRYAEDMKAGRWELNGEPIVFDEKGILKNGQHRLAAIILAETPVKMAVIRGVAEEVEAFDIGSNRTANDISNARGHEFPKEVLSAVNLLFYIANKRATRMEVVEYAEKHEAEFDRTWRCLLNGKNTRYVRRASLVLAAFMMLTLQKMPFYEMEVFFQAFCTNSTMGTDGYEVSSALIARNMFIERWMKGGNQRTQREQLDVVIQAMNDLHAGRKRTNNYKISQPFSYEPLLKKLISEV